MEQNRIIECEQQYILCFSSAVEHKEYVQFSDDLLPDMYKHNFLAVRQSTAPARIKELLRSALSKAKAQNKEFFRMELPAGQDYPDAAIDVPGVVREHLGVYLYPSDDVPDWKVRDGCTVKKIETEEMVEQLTQLDLAHDRISCGEDFCIRRTHRRGQVYLSGAACNSFLCYLDGVPVGNCDLFVHGDTAKIEDFAVLPDYQHKGIGTAILKCMISAAIAEGANVIYLCASEDDTPREMYRKLGFQKVMNFYALLWKM